MSWDFRFESASPFRRFVLVVLLLTCGLLSSLPAQQETAKRKVVAQAHVPYPALARNMRITGVVKIEAVVGANGMVKTLDVKGGHPVLAQAAADSVHQWKWESAPHETHEFVEIRFTTPE